MSDIPRAAVRVSDGEQLRLAALVVVGLAVTVAVIVTEPALGWAGVLVAGVFGITIALGGALFTAIFAATRATWWRPLRRVPLAIAGTLPVPAIAILVVAVVGATSLYPWADPEVVATNHLIHEKSAWLDHTFFIARAVIVLLIWTALVTTMRRKLDTGASLTRIGILFLILFAFTISVATWDWTMSLEPEWYSTMQGVYGFAGTIQVGIAVIALWSIRRRRVLGAAYGTHQVHTLGTLLFAFSFFWGYIWFCQAMLIWYANIPEETLHFAARFSGGWTMLFWLNPIFNLAIPFLVLLSTHAKRSPAILSQVALVVVVGHWLDVFLLVGPAVAPAASLVPYAAVGATAVVLAGMYYALRRDHRFAV